MEASYNTGCLLLVFIETSTMEPDLDQALYKLAQGKNHITITARIAFVLSPGSRRSLKITAVLWLACFFFPCMHAAYYAQALLFSKRELISQVEPAETL